MFELLLGMPLRKTQAFEKKCQSIHYVLVITKYCFLLLNPICFNTTCEEIVNILGGFVSVIKENKFYRNRMTIETTEIVGGLRLLSSVCE